MLFLNNLDLQQNELQNGVVHNLAAAPTVPTPVAGQMYFNTVTNKFYVYDGTAWVTFDSGAVTSITATAPLSANTPDGDVTLSIADATTSAVGVIKLAGDLAGTALLPTVATVGGASAANIADAVTKRHTQNTDTGTTGTSFQIDSGNAGFRIKNVSGALHVRNAADGAFAGISAASIDLNKGELKAAAIENLAAAPSTPATGQIYFNTASSKTFVYNGTIWVETTNSDATAAAKGVIQLAQDLGGTAALPTVVSVGGASAANIADAVSKRHTQNTDTGTTATSFQLNSGATGVRLADASGILEVRNSANSALADLRCNDLSVEGTLTYLHSTEVFIGDQYLVINAQVLNSTNNSNGGLDVRRLLSDTAGTGTITGTLLAIAGSGTTFTTEVAVGDVLIFGAQRRTITAVLSDTSLTVDQAFSPQPSASAFSFANQSNARIFFDVTSNAWKVIDGTTVAPQTFSLARKHSASVGDGTATSYVVTHNLNTRDVHVMLYQTASPYAMVMTDWEATSLSTVTVKFKKAPTTNQYRVVITG